MGGIFISYRRDDSAGHTGRIRDRLTSHFGDEAVFLDVDDIEAGDNFVATIEQAVGGCDAMLVIIGREWLTIADEEGRRRLDHEEDFVRVEVAAALRREPAMKVIPVRIEGAPMPPPDDLPEPLRELSLRNALEVRDTRFDDDVRALIEAIGLPGQRWLSLSKRAWAGVAAAVVAAIILGIVVLPGGGLEPMMGEFNVAVTEFVATGNANPAEASALAGTVHERLDVELQQLTAEGFDFELRGPSDAGRIAGDRDERAAAAAALAEDIAADVIVYGTLDEDGLTPEFYVAERARNFEGAEELTGQFELGDELEAGTIAANRELRNKLAARTQALTQFVIGLSYYIGDDLEEAQARFQAAEAIEGWDAGDGREVLYLFLGNAAGRLGDLDAAQAAYEQGMRENPEYSRVWLGLGEIDFQRSHADCEEGNVDAAGLETALDYYQRALDAADRPARSNVPAKAAVARGRAFTCLSQALVADHWADAEREFSAVVDEYEETEDDMLSELAAEAYAGLGFVVLPAEGGSDAAPYCESRRWYATAQETTRYDERREVFQVWIDFADERVAALDASC